MIKDRPAALLGDDDYGTLPKPPLRLDWTAIPELIRVSMLDLGGVQPLTKAMADAAGGQLFDKPSEGEIKLFRERGTKFQMISVVVTCVAAGRSDDALSVRPVAINLIPASKRNAVQEVDIDAIAALDVDKWLSTEPAYTGYDPFSGEWSLYGNIPGYLDGERAGYLDEIGIVTDQFFLATDYSKDTVLAMDVKMPTEKMRGKYENYRSRLLFAPFSNVSTRRVWGVETPIELFMAQAMAKAGHFPLSQMLLMRDGLAFPSWYHLWGDVEFRHTDGLVTEADFFFPDEKIAVFCDGALHTRKKQREKDEKINAKLDAAGIKAVRIPGSEINFDLDKALARVTDAITERKA